MADTRIITTSRKTAREVGHNRPLVSFVIAVHNAARRLQRCFDSIYRQSFGAWEIVVVDGGSIDGTKDILKCNSDRIAFWVSEPDQGIYDAWNKALNHCTGEWVHFLGADDYLWNRCWMALPPCSLIQIAVPESYTEK